MSLIPDSNVSNEEKVPSSPLIWLWKSYDKNAINFWCILNGSINSGNALAGNQDPDAYRGQTSLLFWANKTRLKCSNTTAHLSELSIGQLRYSVEVDIKLLNHCNLFHWNRTTKKHKFLTELFVYIYLLFQTSFKFTWMNHSNSCMQLHS